MVCPALKSDPPFPPFPPVSLLMNLPFPGPPVSPAPFSEIFGSRFWSASSPGNSGGHFLAPNPLASAAPGPGPPSTRPAARSPVPNPRGPDPQHRSRCTDLTVWGRLCGEGGRVAFGPARGLCGAGVRGGAGGVHRGFGGRAKAGGRVRVILGRARGSAEVRGRAKRPGMFRVTVRTVVRSGG